MLEANVFLQQNPFCDPLIARDVQRHKFWQCPITFQKIDGIDAHRLLQKDEVVK
jgi:hypothetical protein